MRIVKNCGNILAMTKNKNKKYMTETMGCQMNERDSETIGGLLTEMGYDRANVREDADVIVINTCSVRDNADKRFFGVLGQLKKIKEKNSQAVVAVCGCMMQQQHIVDTVKEKYPWVDIVFGTHNIHELPRLLKNVLSEKEKVVDVWQDGGDIVEGLPTRREYSYKSYVNIMYGCNNFCTYCIVPYTRGRERSRKPEDIVKEIKALVADGVKEVTLLGQNVNSYKGMSSPSNGNNTEGDDSHTVDFPDLIDMIDEIKGLERLRFMTSHPKDISDKLIEKYKTSRSLCNYIHLPVQSGSSRILTKMNRHYNKDDYLNLVDKLREVSPDIVITTDLIVGFPGETEDDFSHTMDLIEKVGFDSAFTFIYSVRKGTPAEKYEDQVSEDIKHERFNEMVEKLNEITLEKNKLYMGKVEKVLVEGPSKTRKNMFTGRTDGNKLVNFKGDESLIGQIVEMKITHINTFSFMGEII